MLLHTPAYLLFLTVVVIVYWLVPRTWRVRFLVVCSYGFYATVDIRFAMLLFMLTLITYQLGRQMLHERRARLYLWLGLGLNLGILGVFKYANFFLDSVTEGLHLVGSRAALPTLSLLLPIGISFYTFQAISYLNEVYRRRIQPVNAFTKLTLYLVFFPKLVAGPLIRPTDFIQQLEKPVQRLDRTQTLNALGLLLIGLVKKWLIADSLASLADVAFRAAGTVNQSFPTPLYLQGFYLYAFQIYADFSGYTDLARGSAVLLGFTLPINFQTPYFATTITDFWNRWHMSLTQWFRDYLFFPLSRALLKSNKNNPRMGQIIANFITMILIGLWHGAAWTFIAWGTWHGILLSINRMFDLKPVRNWVKIASTIITFHLVGIGWILFRAPSFQAAAQFFAGLIAFRQMNWLPYYLPSILLSGSLVIAIDVLTAGLIPSKLLRQTRPVFVMFSLVVILSLMLLSAARGGDTHPFIYGQF